MPSQEWIQAHLGIQRRLPGGGNIQTRVQKHRTTVGRKDKKTESKFT